ncbi:MAG: hypothetical protein QOI86_1667, partial [Actinomycetota bacterium]|nr:hypothetical protein [Actinomycetota bacterium]
MALPDFSIAGTPKDCTQDEEAALVPLLLTLTVVAGAVDAVSILRLGHVFVGNMTGNVLFLGFALASASEYSVPDLLVVLVAFLVGAALGGRLFGSTPRRRLGQVAAFEATLCAGAAIVAFAASGTAARYTVTALLAVAMGCQNATARAL